MASMKNRLLGGAKWTSLSALIITIIQIAQFAFLGNVMSLKEFGLVGMITTVTIFTQILLDLGIGAAIIQKEQTTERQLSTLYWINLLTGILLFCVLILASPLIAAFMPDLSWKACSSYYQSCFSLHQLVSNTNT